MWRLILVFVEITQHRRGPEDVPSSQFFLLLVFAVSVCVDFLVLLVSGMTTRIVVVSAVTTVLDFAFVWAALRAFERERRFKQTMSAMLGVTALLSLILVPLALWSQALDAPEGEVTLPWVLMLLWLVWQIDVWGFVLARAIDRPYALGVALMLGWAWLTISLQQTLLQVAK